MKDDAPDSMGPVRWPHSVFSLVAGLDVGPVLEGDDHPGGHVPGSDPTLKDALAEVVRMNRVLKLAGKFECVISYDLIDNLPKDLRSKGAIWDTISDSTNISWVLVTRHPQQVPANLPANWGHRGFANVCIVAFLDGGDDENHRRVEALRKIPARYRGICMPATSIPDFPDGWEQGIFWVIADATRQPADIVQRIRCACQKSKIPFFALPGEGAESDAVQLDIAGLLHHPFKAALNLFENSPYGRLTRQKSPAVPGHLPVVEVNLGDAPITVPTSIPAPVSCPATEGLTDRNEVVPFPVSRPAAVMPPCVDVAESVVQITTDAVILEPEEETPGERFVRLDEVGRLGMRVCIKAGFAFMEIRDNELWREGGYATWNAYCETLLEFGRSYVNRLISHATITRDLQIDSPPTDPEGIPILPVGESLTRPLKKLPAGKKRAKAWRLAVKRAGGMPTAKIVIETVAKIQPSAVFRNPSPSPRAQRQSLLNELREAANSRESWDRVINLIQLLENIEKTTPQRK